MNHLGSPKNLVLRGGSVIGTLSSVMFAFTISIAIVAISALVFGFALFRQRPLAGQSLRPQENTAVGVDRGVVQTSVSETVWARDLKPTLWQQVRSGIVFFMSIVGIGGLIGASLAAAIVLAVFMLI